MAVTEHCNKLIAIQQIKQATVIQLHDCKIIQNVGFDD